MEQRSVASDGQEPTIADVNPELRAALATGSYDFLDLGCSDGSSLAMGVRLLGLKQGIGIDIDERKVAKARAQGHFVIRQDATALGFMPGCVRAVILSHFLEHLGSFRDAAKCIRAAIRAATDFVFIRQPFFDANGSLLRMGYKMYYADWSGHRNLMTTYDIWRAFRPSLDRGRVELHLFGRSPLPDNRSPAIVPLSAPVNSFRVAPEEAASRPLQQLDFPAFREVVAVASKRAKDGTPCVDGRAIAARLTDVHHLVSFGDSQGNLI